MSDTAVNADFSQAVMIETDRLPWSPSPQPGVERRLLDRIGGEVARATSIVRYLPGLSFPAHVHALGEEFLVLDGIFSDEHGDYPSGTYVRNPPGSYHAPRTAGGCIIFVKLRQMAPSEQRRIVLDTRATPLLATQEPRIDRAMLYEDSRERVCLERLSAGGSLSLAEPGGAEILILEGSVHLDHRRYATRSWLRFPAAASTRLSSPEGSVYWIKRGHLEAME